MTVYGFAAGVTTFSQEVFQRGIVKHGIGKKPFQTRIPVLKLFSRFASLTSMPPYSGP